MRNNNSKLQWVPYAYAYGFCTRTLLKLQDFRSAEFFQTWCPANVSSVGKLTADFIAIINFGRQESTFKAHNASQEATRSNKQPTISSDRQPVFRVVARVPCRCLLHLVDHIDFEHRHQSNSNLFYLF